MPKIWKNYGFEITLSMGNKIVIYILTIMLFSCKSKNDTTNNSEKNYSHLIEKYFQHFNKYQWDLLSGLYADSCQIKDPSIGIKPMWQSPIEIEQKYKELNAAIPDVQDSIISVYPAVNNYYVVEFISTGTTPEGKKFELPVCTIFQFDHNGKIKKDYTYYDNF